MNVSKAQEEKIKSVLRVFETGSITPNFSKITVFKDGIDDTYQVTYGAYQFTEDYNLPLVMNCYVNSKGVHSDIVSKYLQITKQKKRILTAEEFLIYVQGSRETKNKLNNTFQILKILTEAGKEKVMQDCQEVIFQQEYFTPAVKWAISKGFKNPLSLLVITDSFVHSGGMKSFLTNKVNVKYPISGGSETEWIRQYCRVRYNFLMSRELLKKTVYRMNCFFTCINQNNWNIFLPINSNGVTVN